MAIITFNPLRIVAQQWRHRYLIGQLVRREVLLKYKGSFLGIGWSFLYPLLLLAAFYFVFGKIFGARWMQPDTSVPFALSLYAGFIVFNFFAEAASRAPGLILAYPAYVKKIIFPLEILPTVLSAVVLTHFVINGALLLVGVFLWGKFHITLWLAPITLLPLILITYSVVCVLSAAAVFVRDLVNIVPVAVQFLMFLSPVFYPASAVPDGMRALYDLNPLTWLIEDFRRTVLWGEAPRWDVWSVLMLSGIVAAVACHGMFRWGREEFADVL